MGSRIDTVKAVSLFAGSKLSPFSISVQLAQFFGARAGYRQANRQRLLDSPSLAPKLGGV